MSILLPCLLAAWATTPIRATEKAPVATVRLAPMWSEFRVGEQLEIRVWRVGGARVTVDAQRKIRHALLGELDLAGWSERDLVEAIRQMHGGAQVVVTRVAPGR